MSFIYFHHKRVLLFGSKKGTNTQIIGSSEPDPKNIPMTLISFIQYFWLKISLIWTFGSFEPHFNTNFWTLWYKQAPKGAQRPIKVHVFHINKQVGEMVIMNNLEWPMISYYVIYYEKFRKVMQQTETEALVFNEKSYDEVLVITNLPMRKNRREQLWKSLFMKMQNPEHKLRSL